MSKKIILILSIFFALNCRPKEKIVYPPIIKEKGLEQLYEKGIVDWHILNSIGVFSKSKYLISYDSSFERHLYFRDTSSNRRVFNRDLLENVDSMNFLFPNKLFDFLEVELRLIEHENVPLKIGDTIVFNLFPETKDSIYLTDPIDGIIYSIYYLDGEVIQVGYNDYVIMELQDSLLRAEEERLNESIKKKGKKKVNSLLWHLTQEKSPPPEMR